MGLIIAVSGVTAEMDTLHIMAFLSFLRVLIDHTVNVYALILKALLTTTLPRKDGVLRASCLRLLQDTNGFSTAKMMLRRGRRIQHGLRH